MSDDARKDFREYREIVADYSKRFIADFPKDAKKDATVQAYRSFDVFMERYPTSEDRDRFIKDTRERWEEAGRKAKEFMEEFFHEDLETGEVLVGRIGQEEPLIRTRWAGDTTPLYKRMFQWVRRKIRELR
jgi:hypothetical protein